MRRILFVSLMAFLSLPLTPQPLAEAYGPRSVTATGNVVKWTLPIRIDLESDLDVRGKDVTSLVEEGLSQWSSLSESNISFTEESLGVAVDNENVCCYLFDSAACPKGPEDDGKNPIVIDDDGEVVGKFFGTANRFTTLGFAAVVTFNATTGEAVKGEAVFNAACLNGVELSGCGSLSFSDDDFTSFIVHEIGHFLGLNHSQVNLDEADDSDTSNDDKITTMYPFFIQGNGANFKTPERDDQVGAAFLYPEEIFASSNFTLSGTVYDTNGTTEFACANLVARNTSSSRSRTDAVSFVSGQLCPDNKFDASCDGNYEIQGLSPSETYNLTVEPISTDFRNSSGIPPCEGSSEQPTFTTETRSSAISSAAGQSVTGANFTLAGTSGNVNSLVLPSLDFAGPAGLDPLLGDEVMELEAKTQTDSCSSDGSSASSSGGCSLIR